MLTVGDLILLLQIYSNSKIPNAILSGYEYLMQENLIRFGNRNEVNKFYDH